VSEVDVERVHAMTRHNRLLLADVLEGLADEQWEAPTLCDGWSVRVLAAHLVQARLTSFPAFVLAALRFRGDTDRTVDHLARRAARRPPAELVALLRAHAQDRSDPPRVGPMGPFADTCLHLRDLVEPLGLDVDAPADHWDVLLRYLTGPTVAPALVPPGRLDGLSLVGVDGASYGPADGGAQVRGRARSLAMAATGRRTALGALEGAGVTVLDDRTRPHHSRTGRASTP
jgi:uncharacterized protein (TIGR03083 family)